MKVLLRACLIAVVLPLLFASSAVAQYFGRSKVRYKSFPFEVLATEHFDIYFYPAERPAAQLAARMAERWYARLSRVLDHPLSRRQPIILYAGHPDFEQTNTIEDELDEGTGGVTEAVKRRVVLPFAGPLAETDHVLGHELVHAFQYDIRGQTRGSGFWPLWFVEGMAEYLSLGPADADTAMWMRDAVARERLPGLKELDDPHYFPYRYGHAFWAYVAGRWGDEAIGRVLKASTRARGPRRALTKTLGLSERKLSTDWQNALRAAFRRPSDANEAAVGQPVRPREGHAPPFEVGPALSPDGRRVAFFSSEHSGGGLSLFMADVEEGRGGRRILRQKLDPHFDSLEFIHSAGAWDSTGHRFAFAAVRHGHAELSVLDAERGVIEREIPLPTVEEILTPSWSPDGRRLAFSALHGGVTDVFVYDLAESRLEALTDDAYADLQPAWSPDGASLAFVTDRFSTDLERLAWGRYQLARLDVTTGAIERLPGFDDAKNINPQWGAGGKVLYFLSDHGGTTNLYRLDPAAGDVRRVTDAAIGISGITALSPALSSAAQADRVVITMYEQGGYRLRALEGPALAGVPVPTTPAESVVLPPRERVPSTLATLLQEPARGLPEPTDLPSRPYRARLAPDRIGEPYLAVGSDPFGVFVSGGASLYWSDMLGNRNVVTGLQVQGTFKDVAGLVGYQDRTHRWSWGAAAQQLVFVTGTTSSGLGSLDGRTVSLEQAVRFRETDRRVTLVAGYPFDRAHRLDLSTSYRDARFATDVTTRAFDLDTGKKLNETNGDLAPPPALHLVELGAALVSDTARFGPTGPVQGARARLEVSPTVGSLGYVGVLADARRYVMPLRPLTVAVRVLHYGRYGRDAENPRLAPLFLGYANLVRGYDFDAFGVGTCIPGGCPRIQSLVGSKLAAGNFELRIPAFWFLGRGREYGPLPTEAVLFFDAGVAWNDDDRPRLLGGRRDAVRSWGAALRINLLGFAVGELDYIRPLDLAGVGAEWRLVLTPGF